MIDLSDLKSGDILTVRVRWNWKALPTYLSRAINFMINFWNGIFTYFKKYDSKIVVRPYCPCNHVMIYVEHEGMRYIYESIGKGFVQVNAYDRLKDITLDNIWCKRYNINASKAYKACESLKGTKYGWVIIFEDLIRLLSNNKISFKWNQKKGMVCSMTGARAINLIYSSLCQYWQTATPEDVHFDKDSQFIILKNI